MSWELQSIETETLTGPELNQIARDEGYQSSAEFYVTLGALGATAATAIFTKGITAVVANRVSQALAGVTAAQILDSLGSNVDLDNVEQVQNQLMNNGWNSVRVQVRHEQWTSGSGNHVTTRQVPEFYAVP